MQGNLCHISIIHLKGTRCLYVGPGVDPGFYTPRNGEFVFLHFTFSNKLSVPRNLNAIEPEEDTCSNGHQLMT